MSFDGMAPRMLLARQAIPAAVTVVKRFGAALRVAPSCGSRVNKMLGCGAYLQVLGESGGWYCVSYVDAVTPTMTVWARWRPWEPANPCPRVGPDSRTRS